MLPVEVSLLEYEKDSTGQGTSRANPRWSNKSNSTGQGNYKTKLKSCNRKINTVRDQDFVSINSIRNVLPSARATRTTVDKRTSSA